MRHRISKNLLALSAGLVVAGVFALPSNDALAGQKYGYENVCHGRVKAKAVVNGYGPDFVLRKKAKRRAIGYWRDKVGNIHGARFDTWQNSTSRKVRCKTVYDGVKCVVKARPCGVVRHVNRYDSGEYYGTGYDSYDDYNDEPVGGQIIIYGGGNYDDDYVDRRRHRKTKKRHKKRNYKNAKRKHRAKRSSRYNTPSGIKLPSKKEIARRRQEHIDNSR